MIWYFGDTVRLKTFKMTLDSFCVGITNEYSTNSSLKAKMGDSILLVPIKGHAQHGCYKPHLLGEVFYERCRLVLTETTNEAIVAWETSNQGNRLRLEPHVI